MKDPGKGGNKWVPRTSCGVSWELELHAAFLDESAAVDGAASKKSGYLNFGYLNFGYLNLKMWEVRAKRPHPPPLSPSWPSRIADDLHRIISPMLRLLFVMLLTTAQIASGQEHANLNIAAAADLQPVLPGLIEQFEQQTHTKVVASYASSATLTTQILNGGPFGLFLAADLSFPQKVVDAGLANSARPVPYAQGTLVLWARNDSPVQPLSVASLGAPSLKTLAVANAEHAPYGRAARAAIEKLALTGVLKDKMVVAENIAQTAQFAESGNADAGLISLTSALSPRLHAEGSFIEMPPAAYPPILQGAVVLKQQQATAHQFLDFLLSPASKKQLAEKGLRAP